MRRSDSRPDAEPYLHCLRDTHRPLRARRSSIRADASPQSGKPTAACRRASGVRFLPRCAAVRAGSKLRAKSERRWPDRTCLANSNPAIPQLHPLSFDRGFDAPIFTRRCSERSWRRLLLRQLRSLDKDQLRDLADALRAFFLKWTSPPLGSSELRGSVGEKHYKHPYLIGDLALYLDTVVMRDPLETWLEDATVAEETAEGLAHAVAILRKYEPCIRHGLVIPAPFPRTLSMWGAGRLNDVDGAALAHELARDYQFANTILPGRVDLPTRLRSIPGTMDQWSRYHDDEADPYLAPDIPSDLELAYESILEAVVTEAWGKVDRMRHAIHAQARFVSLSANDEAAIAGGLSAIGRRLGMDPAAEDQIHQRVIHTLLQADVPALRGITPELALSVRQEDGFEEWRATFRSVVLEAESLTEPVTDQLISDRLFLAAKAAERSVSRSRALSSAFRSEWRRAAVELPLWAGMSTVVPAGKFITAARATGGLARVLAEAIGPRRAEGANAVIVKLVNR